MKKFFVLGAVVFLAGGLAIGSGMIRQTAAQIAEYFYGDPDMPFETGMSKEEYMLRRSEQIGLLRGIDGKKPFDPQIRIDALKTLDRQVLSRNLLPESETNSLLSSTWTAIGPNPIPNGQTSPSLPVSGRTIAIAVHPTNPNLVYVGTAQGGLYRTTDGGLTWTAMMDNALSLAIGAIAIAPSQTDTVYVGTGEPNFSIDSFFGAGIYRIDNASTATPTITGPIGGSSFSGRGIGRIIVHPTDPATIFVASTSGVGSIGVAPASPLPNRGVFRSTDATSASPTFTQIGVLASPNNNFSVRDIAIDPSNPNVLLANLVVGNGGIYRSTNALSATPTWTQILLMANGTAGTSNTTAEFAAIHPAADTNATFYAATGNVAAGSGVGRLLKSTDGGATFNQVNSTAFCSGQCFYDIAVDVDPTNANNVFLGGSPTLVFGRSTDGGTTFTANGVTANGLHSDSHAIAVAPSLPSTIYFGSDGGIYKSIDSGTTWTSLNNTTFSATQFMSLDTHPTDPNITIGGTQDNGTNRYQTAGTWFRTDFGDGGFAVIDQSSSSILSFNQYHTYFNASNLTAYAFTNDPAATEGTWTVRGCNGGAPANGITCTGTINFYAPLERGPGTPNTIYYGADRLYRSADTGLNNTTVSQTFTSPISAIGISPTDDNVRIIGRNDGGIFGTTTGGNPLINFDAANAVPNSYISRAIISPVDANTAYVTLAAYNVANVYKATNLISGSPTWTVISGGGATGLPMIPVDAFLVDPTYPNIMYAGTDIGVYVTSDSGANWSSFGIGLPRVAVFDIAAAPGRFLRIATHGRGLWQTQMLAPTAAPVSVAGRVFSSAGSPVRGAVVSITDGSQYTASARTNSFGYYYFDSVLAGHSYVITVTSAKGYTFTPKSITLNDEMSDVDFVSGSGTQRSPTGIK